MALLKILLRKPITVCLLKAGPLREHVRTNHIHESNEYRKLLKMAQQTECSLTVNNHNSSNKCKISRHLKRIR